MGTKVACWGQNKELLGAWVANGVSVFICPEVGNPQTIPQADLHAKIKALGASYIDKPEGFPGVKNVDSLNRMIADPNCLAIFLDDEPDLHAPQWNPNPVTQPQLVGKFAEYVKNWLADRKWIIDACKAANKPMFLNFTGTSVSNGREFGYQGFIQHSFCDSWIRPIDILCADWYPRNQSPATQPDRYPNTFPGTATKNLKNDFPTVHVWGYVETSKINAGSGFLPSPKDIDEQVAFQLSSGCEGIVWFSHAMYAGWNPATIPNGWDGRPAENKAKCLEIAQKLGSVIVPTTPSTFDAEAAFKKLENSFGALAQQFDVQKNLTAQLQEQLIQLKANAITSIDVKRS